jgi:hypothetical protein
MPHAQAMQPTNVQVQPSRGSAAVRLQNVCRSYGKKKNAVQ